MTTTGLSTPTTLTEFYTVADALQAAGVTPLAFGSTESWAVSHVAETVLLGSMGPDKYRGLWDGSTAFHGPEVTTALEDFDRMLAYANANHASVSWIHTVDRVGNGQAAMTIMGDWMMGYLQSQGRRLAWTLAGCPRPAARAVSWSSTTVSPCRWAFPTQLRRPIG